MEWLELGLAGQAAPFSDGSRGAADRAEAAARPGGPRQCGEGGAAVAGERRRGPVAGQPARLAGRGGGLAGGRGSPRRAVPWRCSSVCVRLGFLEGGLEGVPLLTGPYPALGWKCSVCLLPLSFQ